MFHPLIVIIALLFIWREAERECASLQGRCPAGVATPDTFRAAYSRLVATACLSTVFVAAIALLGISLDVSATTAMQAALGVIGLACALPVLAASETVAVLFREMEHAGRQEGREARDYMPSMVLFPMMPAAAGLLY